MTPLTALVTAIRWTEACVGLRPVINARYEGHQDVEGGEGFDLWTLGEAIPGHPVGSTLSATTIRLAGYSLPQVKA